MRSIVFLLVLTACGSPTQTSDAGSDASVDAAVEDVAAADVATAKDAAKDVAKEAAVCNPPQGTTCPTTAGNCDGIGAPCTKGGGQCTPPTSCDVDLDPSGSGICITYLSCTPGNRDCGNGASCCRTPTTSNVAVCLPNPCIPSDCTAE